MALDLAQTCVRKMSGVSCGGCGAASGCVALGLGRCLVWLVWCVMWCGVAWRGLMGCGVVCGVWCVWSDGVWWGVVCGGVVWCGVAWRGLVWSDGVGVRCV